MSALGITPVQQPVIPAPWLVHHSVTFQRMAEILAHHIVDYANDYASRGDAQADTEAALANNIDDIARVFAAMAQKYAITQIRAKFGQAILIQAGYDVATIRQICHHPVPPFMPKFMYYAIKILLPDESTLEHAIPHRFLSVCMENAAGGNNANHVV
jgi:hypothetical protein